MMDVDKALADARGGAERILSTVRTYALRVLIVYGILTSCAVAVLIMVTVGAGRLADKARADLARIEGDLVATRAEAAHIREAAARIRYVVVTNTGAWKEAGAELDKIDTWRGAIGSNWRDAARRYQLYPH